MRARLALVAAAVACCAALVGLVACSGSGAQGDFAGTWDLYEVQSEDENQVMSADTVSELADGGRLVFLNLNEDGTAQYFLFSSTEEGTWSAQSSTEAAVTLSGAEYALALSGDGSLTLVDGDQTRVFHKGEAKNPSDYEVKTVDKVTDDSFGKITIANDKICKAVAKSRYSDEYGDAGYEIAVTNKSKSTIYFTPEEDFTIDGEQASLIGSVQVEPGETQSSFFYFDKDVIGGGLEKIKNVKGTFDVLDVEKYQKQKSYSFEDGQ